MAATHLQMVGLFGIEVFRAQKLLREIMDTGDTVVAHGINSWR